LKGHYPVQVRQIVVIAINEAVLSGFTQKRACLIFDIEPRKFRRWSNPKEIKPRTACNKILPFERTSIIEASFIPENIGKPLSHIYVYGHNSGAFHVSLSTVYRYLKAEDLVKPFEPKRRKPNHVSAHDLLDAGFSLLTYDGSCFKTNSGVTVWSIPVLLLPCRYLLHIGHCLRGVSSEDLRNAVAQAILELPDNFPDNIVAFSDRGSAMKAKKTVAFLEEELKIPVRYGRPNTPDDEPWIESLNKTSKYHRDVPSSFLTVSDVVDWLGRFKPLYNNDPHSGMHYITPAEAFAGKTEVILNQRRNNLIAANNMRLEAFRDSKLQVVIG
jgi:hypothetical protein